MDSVVGTWRLVRAESHDTNGNILPPPYGGHGMGRVVLAADGRMMAVLCDGRREIPAAGRANTAVTAATTRSTARR